MGDLSRLRGLNLYTIDTYDYSKLLMLEVQKRKIGNPGTRRKGLKYINAICAFDIETSHIPGTEHSIMYLWQFCINFDVILGRTWDEFNTFLRKILEYRKDGESTYCIFVHNLAHEFQYLTGIYTFHKEDIFAVNSRKPVKISMYNHIEMRCSYVHSNMGLDEYTHKMGAVHGKLSGYDFDYSKLRWSDTPLDINELEYAVNDVLGLCEAIQIEMEVEGDTLYSFPLTSTGYVRRELKSVINKECWWMKQIQIPSLHLYELLRKGFRGGNTHASRFFSGKIIKNVKNVDISSAYPDAMINCKYPLSDFRRLQEEHYKLDYLLKLMQQGKALLIDFEVYGLQVRDNVPVPYVSESKCEELDFTQIEIDNGRILSCNHIRTVMTDIDFKIFIDQYDGSIIYKEIYVATYRYLPRPVRKLIIKYFHSKTKYKNATGQEAVYYVKEKNKLNSLYGCAAMAALIISSYYDSENGWYFAYEKDLEEMLDDYNKNVYLSYQIALWVTAHTRKKLQDMIDLIGPEQFIYCDTDSCKYIGDVDINALNDGYRRLSDLNEAYCDHDGKRYYIGIYTEEETYSEFKTLGSKKYIYKYEGSEQIHCTIAGVRKKSQKNSKGEIVAYGGGDELMMKGGMEAFKPGFIFSLAGSNESKYNDLKEPIEYIREDGKIFYITSNVYIYDGEYKVGITQDYARLLDSEVVQKAFLTFIKKLEAIQ